MKEPKEMTIHELEVAAEATEASRLMADLRAEHAQRRIRLAEEEYRAANDESRRLGEERSRLRLELMHRRGAGR